MGPAYSLASTMGPIVVAAGFAAPLALLALSAIMLCIAVSFAYLSRVSPNAGSSYSWIGMAFESQVGIRLGLKIPLEIAGKRNKRLLLAGQQAGIGVRDSRLSGRKVNAVQRKSVFQLDELRRGLGWVLDQNLGTTQNFEAAGVGTIRAHCDCAG